MRHSDTSMVPVQMATNTLTHAIVIAATAFLNTLNASQRAQVEFAFCPQKTAIAAQFMGASGRHAFVGEQYGQAVWSNFPVDDVPRPGLQLGGLEAYQRSAALHLLQVLLSPEGYQKIVGIMDSDQVLSESGTPYAAGKAHYTLGIFGTPDNTAPWMLQFGGHHLALNAVIAGPNVTFTPMLTGAHPAVYALNGRTVRPLGQETDKAFQLINTFDLGQQQKAVLPDPVYDLVLGPGRDGETLSYQGLSTAEMTEAQQRLLLDLVSEWVGIGNADIAGPRMVKVRDDLRRTYFAWYGNTTYPSPVYFRITGPTLDIEFANQQWNNQMPGVKAGGVNHIHTLYRDPTNDYGRGFTALNSHA